MPEFTATPPSRFVPPGIAARLLITGVAAGGVAASMVLLRSRGLPGCGPGSGCEAVLSSRWSQVLGVPVSAAAIVVYAITMAMLVRVRVGEPVGRQRLAWRVLIGCAAALLGAAAWFIVLQWAVLGQWCRWCMAAHGCGIATGLLILWFAPIGRERLLDDEPPDPMMISPMRASLVAALALAGVAAMAMVQRVQPWRPAITVAAFGGLVGEPTDVPLMGEPSAKHLLMCMYDYTCPHCRAMHGKLKLLHKRFGGELAIVLMPVPLDARCNAAVIHTEPAHRGSCELAELALAVWRAHEDRFAAMDDWLFASPRAREVEAARAHATSLVGADALQQALDSGWPRQQIDRAVTLYRATGEGALPRLMPGGSDVPREVFTVLERELGAQLVLPHRQ